ncbi:type II secretion system F family protein [Thiofaba sp. EF100]|jgi:tight adherence protein C|uniref:type II secretion system F family protein n=1 Tax=Thiofaba sp. EF100 TaxID=3121274 RepID=UPI0032218D9D
MQDFFNMMPGLPEGWLTTLSLILAFLATVLLVMGVLSVLMGGPTPIERRLDYVKRQSEQPERHRRTPHQEGGFEVRWLEPAMKLALPSEAWKRSETRTKLIQAGIRHPNGVAYYYGFKFLLAVALPLLALVPVLVMGYLGTVDRVTLIAMVVLAAVVGFYLPNFYVAHRREKRQLEFSEGFPDAMDMLVVCVEAGLGLDAAIQRVGEEIAFAHPELAIEFQLVSLELRAGKSREDALRSLALRTGIEEVQALVTLLIQAEHFGTSIAAALRTHATEMRSKRIDRARERAAKLPVKLIFPIILFIFPALFLVVLGPAVVSIYKGFVTGFGG